MLPQVKNYYFVNLLVSTKKGTKGGSSRMADVEMLIDKLNNKMTSY